MSFYIVSLFFTGISSILLGGFVFKRDRPANISLALYTFAVAVWCLGQAFGELSPAKEQVLFWTRINLSGAIFIPFFYYTFVNAFLGEKKKIITYAGLLFCFVLLILDTTPFFISDVSRRYVYRYYPVAGPGYLIFAGYFFVMVATGFYKLVQAARNSVGNRRNQILYIILASIMGFGGGVTAFLPAFNIDFPYLAHYFLPFYFLVAIYAIFRHQLLDIRVILRGGLVYSIITLFFTGIYALLVFSFKEFFQAVTGWHSFFATIVIVFGGVILFDPLRKWVQGGVDKLFFREKIDYQKALKDLSQAAVTIFDEKELIDLVTKTIKEKMRVKSVAVMPHEADSQGFELSYKLVSKGVLFGTLNLGAKESGEMYTEEDKDLLVTLANQMAIALNNAALYREVLRSEKLNALGTMAAGLAHEIKNPLASIKGMTQILPENIADNEFIAKYSDIVPRQLDRINNIIETLLKIGKPQSFVKTRVDLSKILLDLIKLIESQCREKKIAIEKEIEEKVFVEGDADQLMQAFMNLILNAVDSMPHGGRLKILNFRYRVDYAAVEVSDAGSGISPENLKKVFDPFFTTKEKGSGLGLAVTYRIIKEHKGEIEVLSELNKGTTFKVWLCIKQKE
ncbi:MAG: integral membrane sensor signal transduction histidine kinase [Candidatus Saganbacteria bacterium]|uniref:histidine kinase n=1 Tax=Candidatus Saganbacteria bacterium TaxID=2575572 RepID=A0A833L182_UNCSA|nr:MAG: integral membrane sensor signal transduction histidine kinase [Candidatus Saganbacteria bacterium]